MTLKETVKVGHVFIYFLLWQNIQQALKSVGNSVWMFQLRCTAYFWNVFGLAFCKECLLLHQFSPCSDYLLPNVCRTWSLIHMRLIHYWLVFVLAEEMSPWRDQNMFFGQTYCSYFSFSCPKGSHITQLSWFVFLCCTEDVSDQIV